MTRHKRSLTEAMLRVRDLSRNKQFRQILTFYSTDRKDTTQDRKDTTQDERDILGTKGTKRGNSGQKETIGTFEVFFFFNLSRVDSHEWLLRVESEFCQRSQSTNFVYLHTTFNKTKAKQK